MTVATENESTESNVIYMAEYLHRKISDGITERDRLTGIVEDLSKHDKDKFAARVQDKVNYWDKKLQNMTQQLKFIIRGGAPVQINPPHLFHYQLKLPVPTPTNV